MRVNLSSNNSEQIVAFQQRRAVSILEEARRAYDQFSRLRNFDEEVKLGTVHVPVGCRENQDGGLVSDQIINVDLQTYKGYFVAHNSSITLFSDTGYRTHPLDDVIYEIISPAEAKYTGLSGQPKEKVIKAIIDSVEVSSTPAPQGLDQVVDELILPILFDANVDVRTSIDDLPLGCRLSSKHSIAALVDRLLQGKPLKSEFSSRLNRNHAVLLGPRHLRFFERGIA